MLKRGADCIKEVFVIEDSNIVADLGKAVGKLEIDVEEKKPNTKGLGLKNDFNQIVDKGVSTEDAESRQDMEGKQNNPALTSLSPFIWYF